MVGLGSLLYIALKLKRLIGLGSEKPTAGLVCLVFA
jgi:hypothetical protein